MPASAYVPGRGSRPREDPAPAQPLDPPRWRMCRRYLHGIDLFEAGFYWEAHEAWEAVWNAQGRRGTEADFLRGLIKLAAAGVKLREQRCEGVRRHAARAAELFSSIHGATGSSHFAGLDLLRLARESLRLATGPPPIGGSEDGPRRLPITLSPGEASPATG